MYKVTVPAATLPLTLDEVKSYLRVEHDEDDTLIGMLIEAAVEYSENYTGRKLMTQTIEQTFDAFPSYELTNLRCALELRWTPIQSISSFVYVDVDGENQTLTTSHYIHDNFSEPNRLFPPHNESWKCTKAIPNAVKITYVAGYTQATDVPAQIRLAMLLMIAKNYEMRENSVKNLPTLAEHYLKKHKVILS